MGPAPGGPAPLPARDPATGPGWAAALAAVAALFRAGLAPAQVGRLLDLRGRVQQGRFAADGAGPPGCRRPAPGGGA